MNDTCNNHTNNPFRNDGVIGFLIVYYNRIAPFIRKFNIAGRFLSNGEFISSALLWYNMLMDEDTLIEVDGRQYLNPQKGLDERMAFIDTLRDVQAQNTAQINQSTYNLGSPVTSNVGGLGGSEALWQAQYQTPQINAQIADLKAVVQQAALNQAMQNLSDIYQNRHKQASRNYAKRAKATSSSGPGTAPIGEVDIDYGADEKVNVNKLSEAAQKSLNTVADTNKAATSGIMLWEGYRPNLSYAQNMFNYMSHLAQTRGQTDKNITRNNSLTRGGL